jgi:outer membrane protein OmpA-like peptidoglycan-associated protein
MRYASDEREHRRGLVLGLTMAEVLLLLLFLLLLALSTLLATRQQYTNKVETDLKAAQQQLKEAEAKLREMQAALEQLGPVLGQVAKDPEAARRMIENLVQKLAKLQETEKNNEALKSQLAEASAQLEEWKRLAAEANRVNPNDPPAATLLSGLQRSKVLRELEDKAREIDPKAPPVGTLTKGLEEIKRSQTADRDAKMGRRVQEVAAVLRNKEKELNERLGNAFGGKLGAWGAEIDPASLTLRFQRPDLMFEQGSANLRRPFADFLNEFFPEYLGILHNFRDDIEEVRIEGHTSSEWSALTTSLQAYFLNMALSQERTRTVLEYGLTRTQAPAAILEWARERITANGLSSSRLRYGTSGSEDPVASRRVEFRVLMKSKEQLLRIVDPGT